MAKLIKKHKADTTFACYSERGIIAHLMFRVLPVKLAEFLTALQFPKDIATPFADVKQTDLSEIVLFSELDFGAVGFGKPDGAVSFKYQDTLHLLFLEGKSNESYLASCGVKKLRNSKVDRTVTSEQVPGEQIAKGATLTEETESAQGYNSTIRGQLELRYRAVRLYKGYRAHAVKPEVKAGKVRYCLREIEEVKNFYGDKDGFYLKRKCIDSKKLKAWRHLYMTEGVKDVFGYVDHTPEEHILFLAFTTDTGNPFDVVSPELRPRLFDSTWKSCRHRFPWISSHEIETKWDNV